MSAPVRIQLSRRKGWRMPPDTISVARPTEYGNRYIVGAVVDHVDGTTVTVRDRAHAVHLYREGLDWRMTQVKTMRDGLGAPWRQESRVLVSARSALSRRHPAGARQQMTARKQIDAKALRDGLKCPPLLANVIFRRRVCA
jgi:hypothetical protein